MSTENKIKVSVIVPVYNTETSLLEKCFVSLDSQKMQEIEIIVVDDGSCVNTSDFCSQFANSHDKFVYYRIENSGVSAARNKGIELSKGQYITFVDSDDWIEKDTLFLLYNEAVNSEADIVLYDVYLEYKIKTVRNSFLESDFQPKLSIDQFQNKILYSDCNSLNIYGIVVGKLYKSSLLRNNSICFSVGISMSEDQIFALKAFQHSKNISIIKGNFYHYVIHQNSVCNSYNEKFDYLNLTQKVYDELLDFYNENHKSSEFYTYIYLKLFKLVSVVLTKHIFNVNSDLKLKDQIDKLKIYLNQSEVQEVLKNIDFSLLKKRELFMYLLIKLHMYRLLGMSIHYKQQKNLRMK